MNMVNSLPEPESSESATGGELSEDLIFDLLSAGRRRAVLRHLEHELDEVSFSDLTEAVAIKEGLPADGTPDDYKKVYVSLYQTHVPKLEQAGVIEYDRDENTVSLTEKADPVLAYLNFTPPSQKQTIASRLARRITK